jgi:uncharacterized membrane protein
MDAFTIVVLIGVVVAVFVALSRSNESVRRVAAVESQVAALRQELGQLTKRIRVLEKDREGQTEAPGTIRTPTAQQQAQDPSLPVSAVATPPPPPPANAPAPDEPAAGPARPREPVFEQLSRTPSFGSYSPSAASATARVKRRQWSDIEERLGTNWLNKIGTAAFVIGVALLLNYSMHYLGPAGKIALGYTLGIFLLAAGILGERNERYRIAGRAVLGGGWALLYFTTYAMHSVAAVRIVDNPTLGFALLFAVAAAMVAHSLRYHSQVTTGFAYLLAFVSVGVGEIPVGGLIAAVLLVASLALVMRARQWFAIEPFAIVATYLLHWIWLSQTYQRIGGHKMFPGYAASVALLSTYWLLYLISYFLRVPKKTSQVQLLTAAFLLNAIGYLTVLHYQSFHPAWRFWFLLAAGAVYLAISGFSRKIDRRLAFILASTLGAALLIAAIPYRFSGGNLEILWLIEVESLLLVGWRLADAHLRLLGWTAAAVLAIYAGVHHIVPRFVAWQEPNAKAGWLLVALAAAFFVNGRMRKRLAEHGTMVDRIASIASPILATGFALAAAWMALPFFWPGLVWLLIAVALTETGKRFGDPVWQGCGYAASVLAASRLLTVNLFHTGSWRHVSLRLITVGASSLILYLYSRRAAFSEGLVSSLKDYVPDVLAAQRIVPALFTATATLLVSILLWDEITSAAVALAWGVFGLALLESSRAFKNGAIRLQAYAVLFASFARIFIADLNSTAHVGAVPVPVLTVGVLIAIFYYSSTHDESSAPVRKTFLWLGTAALAALFRFELAPEWVAVSWAALAVAFYVFGRASKSSTLQTQSYVLTLAAGVRCAFDNFYQVGRWHFTTVRVATVVASAALIYALFFSELLWSPKSAEIGQPEPQASLSEGQWKKFWHVLEQYPRHLFFFVPTLLLTVLISLEVRRGFLTAAWGVEALVVFLLVLKMRERVYRWFSLSLLMLCVIRIVTVDVWNLDALGRIVSFLALGLALLAVSFLYARYREFLRKVL